MIRGRLFWDLEEGKPASKARLGSGKRLFFEVKQLYTQGSFTVEQVLDLFGCLTGSANEEVA